MSTLKVTNIQSNAAGFNDVVSFQTSGGTQNGTLCRAWVNFDGTGTVAIRANFNVSSITDNGAGDYTVNFTNAMTDANYAACLAQTAAESGSLNVSMGAVSYTASGVRVLVEASNGSNIDVTFINVAIFR